MNNIKRLSTISAKETSPYCLTYYKMAKAGHFWIEWRFQVFLKLLHDSNVPVDVPFKGLDAGCGNGIVRQQIEQHTRWSVDGADLTEQVLWLNRAKRGERLLYNIVDRHASLQEAYDLIILFDVIEHIADPKTFLEAVLYHLKPRGWLFINVPAFQFLFSSYDSAQKHYRRYNQQMMQAILASAQVDIHDMRYWGWGLIPFALMRKFLPSKHKSPQAILERGFKPPSRWMNAWLLNIMRIEIMLFEKPNLGTSLMTAAIKPGQ